MTTRKTYWTLQVVGWGAYSAAGIFSVTHSIGWRPAVAAGYLLFGLYSIALTELFRREIFRRQWLNNSTARMFGSLLVGAGVVGSTQTFLVIAVDFALQGSRNSFLAHPINALALWVGAIGVALAGKGSAPATGRPRR
jgi:hypothetical protein